MVNIFRGTGLNKHCKYLLFQFLFETLEVERIGFAEDNRVSLNALKSVGAKKEGVLLNFLSSLSEKGRTDCVLLSILKEEWSREIKQKLKNKLSEK